MEKRTGKYKYEGFNLEGTVMATTELVVRDVQREVLGSIRGLLSSVLDVNGPAVSFLDIARSNDFTSIVQVVRVNKHRLFVI